MKLEIIGRDPKLTMQITKMIGARAAKEKRAKDRINKVLSPITMVSNWIGGLL